MKFYLILLTLFSVIVCPISRAEGSGFVSDWSIKADNCSKAFFRNYWNPGEKYFNYGNNGSKTDFHYWPQAHALDLMADAWFRSGDTVWLTTMNAWFEGVPRKNGGSFSNRYFDDMEWNALALLRAYQATGNKKFSLAAGEIWEEIKTGWNDHAGGGIMWEKENRYGKNSCSNGPAAILAARLFRLYHRQSDLEWAKKIFAWQRNTLFDSESGAVWDNIKENGGTLTINKKWVFTYNQGTFLGAATELFTLTGDSLYLDDAIKAADYTLNSLISPDGLLKDEGKGDGGLFKGIFVRYLTGLIRHHALPPEKKKRYCSFLFYNAQTLWTEGIHKNSMLCSPNWKTNPGETSDLTVALSGAMLMEAVADLERAGYVKALSDDAWPEWSGNPVFNGWYADPEAVIYGKRYWIYPTFSAEYEKQVHFDCFSSPDLVHWTKHVNILDTADVHWARQAMWAPGVMEKKGRYYLFFAANDVHEGELGGIGVAVADQPEGPYMDLTGKPLIGNIVNGAQPIDQFVFRDRDGSYYLIYGGWKHCNIVRLKNSFTGLRPLRDGSMVKEITPEGYVEGPVMFRKNGRYYFMWSEGGWTGPDYRVAYAISDNLYGPWQRIGTVLQQDGEVATGAGHHSILNIPGTDDWYIVYHRRPLSETSPHHRVTCIERMKFDENGFILPVKITFEGVTSRPLNFK
jgi:predicted alpha-1,6-mannanase (GH76 family)